jgi:hypothetical protein
MRESDFRSKELASGFVYAGMGQGCVVGELAWNAVTRPKTWLASEATARASWEQFHRDCIWGKAPWGTPGGPIRFYPDAASSSTFATYTVPGAGEINPEPVLEGWASGYWKVVLPRLVLDPTYAAYG